MAFPTSLCAMPMATALVATYGTLGRYAVSATCGRLSAGLPSLEQSRGRGLDAAELVVVENDAADATVLGEHACLWCDLLRREHAPNRPQQRVALQPFDVARELFDPVDLTPPLDLHGHGLAVGVAAQQVDRADVGRVLPAYQ